MKILNPLENVFVNKKIPWILICIGAVLRLKYFLENHSLWVDEAYSSLDISVLSFSDILSGKSLFPGLPHAGPLFMGITKIISLILGDHEMSVRILSLIAGIASLLFFYFFLKRALEPKIMLVALALFVFAEPLIYYSAQMKRYGVEILISVFLLWFFEKMREKDVPVGKILLFIATGAAVLWLAYPSAFVLAGIFIVLAWIFIKQKQWGKLFILLFGGLIWLCSVGLLYKIYLSKLFNDNSLIDKWAWGFAPRAAFSWEMVLWLKRSFLDALKDVVGVWPTLFSIGLLLLGGIGLFFKDRQKCFLCFFLISSVLFASWLHKYAFYQRLILFLAPVFIILLTEGVVFFGGFFKKASFVVYLCLITGLLFYPVKIAAANFAKGHVADEEMRPVFQIFKDQYRENDAVYLNNSAQFTFGYYHGYFGLGEKILLMGCLFDAVPDEEYEEKYLIINYYLFNKKGFWVGILQKEIAGELFRRNPQAVLKNKRTWLVLSRVDAHQKEKILRLFNKKGVQAFAHEGNGASIYLFNMSGGT